MSSMLKRLATRNSIRFIRATLLLAAFLGCSSAHEALANDYEAEVRSDRPIAWWRFQELAKNDGVVVADAMGRYAGQRHGQVKSESGPPQIAGSAAVFELGDAYLEVPHCAAFEIDAISVELWFKSAQPWQQPQWPGSATLISKATTGASSGDWTVNGASNRPGENEGRIVVSCGPRGETNDVNTISPATTNDGRWHHVVWTHSDDGLSHLYLDGRLVDEAEDQGGSIVNQRPIQIGGGPHENGHYFRGAMAEVAIFGGELSPERVLAHALAGGLSVSPKTELSHSTPLDTMALTNLAGMTWELVKSNRGWALGRTLVHGKPLSETSAAGIVCLRNTRTGQIRWLAAQSAERINSNSARLSGSATIDEVVVQFSSEIALDRNLPAARWTIKLQVERELKDWEICVAPWEQSSGSWRCWLYPFAGNSRAVTVAPLRYCGVPAAIVYRPDLSQAVLFGIDPASDYLHPNTWTGATSFHFQSRRTPPEFRFGGSSLLPHEQYRVSLQLIASDAGTFTATVPQLVNSWIELNQYRVEPLQVGEPEEAAAIFLAGRRASQMWRPGKGYQIQDAWPVIYMPEAPVNAYLDYLLFEKTGDRLWRDRAFQIMEFLQRAQHRDPADPHVGAIESHYNLDEDLFASTDRGNNLGLKPDMNAYAARYTFMLWERVKQHEGLDCRDWYEMGLRMALWVARQQRSDGGLPQVVGPDADRNAISVVSGRALVALPIIRRITGDAQFDACIERHEQFVRHQVEGRLWYTGAHTDLPPQDYESDSVWQVVEYWLNKYEATRQPDCLDHAQANALLAFLMLCPKQLPWVANPTQTSHAEQQHYLQYSNYCYNNAKIACLHRLGEFTHRELYHQLCDRIVQCGLWSQERSGPWMGSVYERMSDPWLGVSPDVNSKGTRYMSELAVEFQLQLLELGLVQLGGEQP